MPRVLIILRAQPMRLMRLPLGMLLHLLRLLMRHQPTMPSLLSQPVML